MTARESQVGGEHYSKLAIQPIDYIYANELGWCEANVLKYITRWRDKGGLRDLEKARHYIDLLIEREGGSTSLEKYLKDEVLSRAVRT